MTLAGKWKQETAENLDDFLKEMGQFFIINLIEDPIFSEDQKNFEKYFFCS